MNTLKSFFIAEANRYNHYIESETENQDKKCRHCIRKRYSYPNGCKDGWNHPNKTGCLNYKKGEK